MSEKPKVFKRDDMLSINKICKLIPGKNGSPCSRQHVYNLIERGELTPAFRFGSKHCLCVPRNAVERYVESCMVDPGL